MIFEPNNFPADWNKALDHSNAARPGLPPKNLRPTVCPCCLQFITKEPVSIWEHNKQLFFLGEGFPLFYTFLKICIVLTLVLVLDSSILSMFLNWHENRSLMCGSTTTSTATMALISSRYRVTGSINPARSNKFSSGNRLLLVQKKPQQNLDSMPTADMDATGQHFTSSGTEVSTGLKVQSQSETQKQPAQECIEGFLDSIAFLDHHHLPYYRVIIKVISFTIHALLLLYSRNQLNRLADYMNQRHHTLSDYAFTLTNIPKGLIDNQTRLRLLISDGVPDSKTQKILLIQDLEQYYALQKKHKKFINQKVKSLKSLDAEKIQEIRIQEADILKLKEDLRMRMEADQERYFAGSAIVVMACEKDRVAAVQYLNSDLDPWKIKTYFQNYDSRMPKLRAKQSLEPLEIDWENIHYDRYTKRKSRIISWIISIFLLILVTTVFFLLVKFKAQKVEESRQKHYNINQSLVICLVLSINAFNKFLFAPVLHSLSGRQKRVNHSAQQFSFALKYMISMFFTTALLTLAVEAIIYNNFKGRQGIVVEQSIVFMFNALFSPIVWLINPYYIIYKFRAWSAKRSKQVFTQIQANIAMEYPVYDMGKRYAQNMKTMWFTFLYADLIPIGPIISFMGLILYYFVDKRVLLNQSSVKANITRSISRHMMSLLDLTLLLKPAGETIFDYHLRDQTSISSIIMLVIAFVFVLLPKDLILSKVFPQKYHENPLQYQDIKYQLVQDYENCYPRTQRINSRESKIHISKEAKDCNVEEEDIVISLNQEKGDQKSSREAGASAGKASPTEYQLSQIQAEKECDQAVNECPPTVRRLSSNVTSQ